MENRGEVEYSSILTVKSNVKKNLSMGTLKFKGIGTAPTDPDEECYFATFVDSLRAVDHIVKSESPVFYSKIF